MMHPHLVQIQFVAVKFDLASKWIRAGFENAKSKLNRTRQSLGPNANASVENQHVKTHPNCTSKFNQTTAPKLNRMSKSIWACKSFNRNQLKMSAKVSRHGSINACVYTKNR